MVEAVVAEGLEGVVSHRSALSEVDGVAGRLILRGYDIDELVGRVSFEEAAYLLWHGSLPDGDQLGELRAQMAETRRLPRGLLDWLVGPGRQAVGMHALRMATSMLTLGDPAPDSHTAQVERDRAVRLTAQMPLVVAQQARARRGLPPIEVPAEMGIAASYLYLLEGEVPSAVRVRALDAYLVTVIEHGMNASTFTARVIASTGSDMVSALTGAVGALKGPLHGGVPGPVLAMLREIETPEHAEGWIRAALGRGEVIMGFGHRVYRVRDPRAAVLSRVAASLADARGDRRLLELTEAVEQVTVQVLAELKPGRDLYVNMELYAALVLHTLGIE